MTVEGGHESLGDALAAEHVLTAGGDEPPERADQVLAKRQRRVAYGLLAPGTIYLLIAFIVPMFIVVFTSLQSGGLLSGGYTFTWEFSNYTDAFSQYKGFYAKSLLYSGIATVICILLAYPMMYWVAFYGGRWKSTLFFLILVPFFVSFVIRTVQWKFILADDGLLFAPLKSIGLLPEDFQVLATPTAVIAGITYNFLPFTALPLYVALERIDRRLVEAAKDLYATKFQAFRKVVLPLSFPGVFAAVVLTFVPADGRLRELPGARVSPDLHDRPGDPAGVPDPVQLPDRLGALGDPDDRHADPGADLREAAGYRGRCPRRGSRHMSAVTVDRPPATEIERPPLRKKRRPIGLYIMGIFTVAMIVYLASPIFVMILYGFNDIAGERQVARFTCCTLNWWKNIAAIPPLNESLKTSIAVAVPAALIATALGALIGLVLGRYRFHGRGGVNFVIFLAIAVPEIVLGSALLAMFVRLNSTQPAGVAIGIGYPTILFSHIGFAIAFVAITVRARVQGLDRSLENAAQDLFATPLQAFFRVTFPLILPGIVAGFLLAFVLSLDDFVITNFVQGQTNTFPTWVYGATRLGVPPQVNVWGTVLFSAGLLAAGTNLIVGTRASRRKN